MGGWAPLQLIAIRALQNYKFDALTDLVAKRWVKTCEDVYTSTGKIFEKYNVQNPEKTASG